MSIMTEKWEYEVKDFDVSASGPDLERYYIIIKIIETSLGRPFFEFYYNGTWVGRMVNRVADKQYNSHDYTIGYNYDTEAMWMDIIMQNLPRVVERIKKELPIEYKTKICDLLLQNKAQNLRDLAI